MLEQLTGQQPVFGKARYTVRTFAIRRNEKISTSVTVRGEKALQLIVRLLALKPEKALHKGMFGSTCSCFEWEMTCSAGGWLEGEGVRASEAEFLRDRQLWIRYQ